jgi:hypothetical protein
MSQQPPPPSDPERDAEERAAGSTGEPRPAAARAEALGPEAPPPSAAGPEGLSPEPPRGARWEEPRPEDRRRDRPAREESVKSKRTWLRLVFIVLFAILYGIAEFVLTAVVVIQFVWVLLNGEPNEGLRRFGQSLARYVYQIIRYVTFNSDARPFPIDLDWPPGERTLEP